MYCAPPEGAEILLGKGKQPAATVVRGEPLVVWQDGAGLVRTLVLAGTGPIAHAAQGRFAVLAPAPDGRGALLAYEQGPAKSPHVVIEKF